MSSEGTITADIIKNAMFKAAGDIEGRYSKMPKTFGDYWVLIKNKAIQSFTPIIEKINALINTPQFEEFFNNLCIGIQVVAEAVNWLIDGIGWLYQTLEPFSPVIWAIVGALIAFKVCTMLVSAAQAILNAVMNAGSTTLMITALAAIVAALLYLYFTNEQAAYWILYFWDALQLGAMALALGCKAAFYSMIIGALTLKQGFLGVVLGLQTGFYTLQLGFLALELGFKATCEGIANAAIWMYNKVAGVLNKFGANLDTMDYVDFTSNVQDKISKKMNEYAKETAKTYTEIQKVNSQIDDYTTKLNDVTNNGANEIQNKAKELEKTRNDRVKNRNNWINNIKDKVNGVTNKIKDAGSIKAKDPSPVPVKPTGGKVDNSGQVKMSDEDLKYMKDFAEQQYVNKFTTATLAPNVAISFGDVHETADANKLKDRLKEILEEEIAEVAEGVY